MHTPDLPPAPHARAAARPIVALLHASGSSSRQWTALRDELEPRFEVHLIELHGHGGRAGWPQGQPFSLHDDAALLEPLLHRVARTHLVGHSYGAAVALHVAATRQQRVRSVVAYEPPLFRVLAQHDPAGPEMREALDVAVTVRVRVDRGDAAGAAREFVDFWTGAGSYDAMPEPRRDAVHACMPMVARQFEALADDKLQSWRLAHLTLPALCLSGSATRPLARRIATLLRHLMPGARHEVLPGLGHMGPLTHPLEVNRRIVDFLDQQLEAPSHEGLATAA